MMQSHLNPIKVRKKGNNLWWKDICISLIKEVYVTISKETGLNDSLTELIEIKLDSMNVP